MTSREAFEAWLRASNLPDSFDFRHNGIVYANHYVESYWRGWQAAIQHASDVAEDCIEHELGETGQAKAIVHAIKEALK